MRIARDRVRLALVQRTHQGKFLDFDEWPYLEAIYRDPSPDICIMSCVKSGKSEWLIATDMALCMAGLNVLHCLPDEKVRNRFVQARVDPTIALTPEYRTVVRKRDFSDGQKKSDSTSLKRIGTGHCNYVGTNSEAAFVEYVADALLIDELDRCNARNLTLAPDRMDASELKLNIAVGNPTLQSHGIDALFQESDQKQWHIVCPSCSEPQVLDFFKNVVEVKKDGEGRILDYRLRDPTLGAGGGNDYTCLCYSCGSRLERLERGRHRAYWQSTGTENRRSGYQISQIFSPRVMIRELWDRLNRAKDDPGKLQVFYNSNLGLPSTPSGSSITEAMLEKCKDKYHMPTHWRPGEGMVTAGIDVGSVFYVRISDVEGGIKRRCMFAGTLTGWDTLTDTLKRYGVRIAVIDASPETHSTIEWQKSYAPFTIWRVGHNVADTNVKEPSFDHEVGLIQISRTVFYDMAFTDWRRGNHFLPSDWRSIEGYLEQMTRNTRFLDYDARGAPVYRWTDSKPDHHWSADAFDCLAGEIARTYAPSTEVYSTGEKRAGIGEVW